MNIETFPDRLIKYNGETYHYFGGTSYLGMATLPEFQEQIFKSIKQWGTIYGSSRNANVHLNVYEMFENAFSEFVEAEDAIAVSSGTLAGKMVVQYFAKHNCRFFHYPNSHPAVLHNESTPVFIKNTLHPDLINTKEEEIVIVLDAVLSAEVTPTSLDFLRSVSPTKRINLVVDESHSLGIVGNYGEGIFNSINADNIYRKIMVTSLGKALGISGGIIVSNADFIAQLKTEDIFVSASAANPAYLDAFLKSQHLYRQQREKLNQNLKFLFDGLELKPSFKFNPDYPVIYCNESTIYNKLLKNKIVIANFKYPNYEALMSRIVITANHTPADLDLLRRVLEGITNLT
ncbi:MAG: aminotransferase class I/II-fold pyridoxal phosphate-dependent enzyme [Aestuariibaculum sp.]